VTTKSFSNIIKVNFFINFAQSPVVYISYFQEKTRNILCILIYSVICEVDLILHFREKIKCL